MKTTLIAVLLALACCSGAKADDDTAEISSFFSKQRESSVIVSDPKTGRAVSVQSHGGGTYSTTPLGEVRPGSTRTFTVTRDRDTLYVRETTPPAPRPMIGRGK